MVLYVVTEVFLGSETAFECKRQNEIIKMSEIEEIDSRFTIFHIIHT